MLRLLTATAVSALALVAPGSALAGFGSGDIGVSASTRMDAETFARDPSLRKSEFWKETATGTATASSSYGWPAAPFGGELFSCPATGCAGFEGRAMGSVDVSAGLLHAVATARVYVGNEPNDGYGLAGYIFSDGKATIADTITLSSPATVVLKGRVTGRMGGSADTERQPWPRTELLAVFSFAGEPTCDLGECVPATLGGYEQRYEAPIVDCGGACTGTTDFWASGGEPVDDAFEVAVALPAGTSTFTGKLLAGVHFQVYGLPLALASSNAFLDFGNSAEFEIHVPEGVVATSGSGLLPIVGGSGGGDPVPPADTQAPSLQLPADLTVEATGPSGSAVTYVVGATDDRDATPAVSCTPPSGSTFALGATTVTCAARDAAGNEATGSFTVRVADTTAPVLSFEKVARTVRTYHFLGARVVLPIEATDLVDPAPLVHCVPAAGQRLPVGETVIRCTAVDDAGNRSETSVTIEVLGPAQLLLDLIKEVHNGGLDADTELKLLTPLERARLALQKTRVDGAETALEAFVGEVEKQSRKGGIAPARAAGYISLGTRLLRGLFPLARAVVAKVEQIVDVLDHAGLGPFYQPIRKLLEEVRELVAAGEKGRALTRLRDAQEELNDLGSLGLVPGELATAAKRDLSTLLAVLSGKAKDANPKG